MIQIKFNDLTGKKFNRLLVLSRDEQTDKKGVYFKCKCDCGNVVSVRSANLVSGSTKSCGCLNEELIHRKKRNYEDITGLTFGNLEVLSYYDSTKDGTRWLCKCHLCGSTTIKVASRLKSAKSCGCLEKKASIENLNSSYDTIKTFKTNIGIIKRTECNRNNKTTGVKGVTKVKSTGKYVAYITFQGIRYTLKRSFDIEKCKMARKEAEKFLHKDFLKWYHENYENDKNE